MKDKDKSPKCWICKDEGMVFYKENYNGLDYEFAAKCKCKLGQISSSSIMTVIDELAEKMAMKNYVDFKNSN